MRMNKKKSLYEAPTTDVLVVRFEENIMSPGPLQANGTRQGNVLDSGSNGFDDWD